MADILSAWFGCRFRLFGYEFSILQGLDFDYLMFRVECYLWEVILFEMFLHLARKLKGTEWWIIFSCSECMSSGWWSILVSWTWKSLFITHCHIEISSCVNYFDGPMWKFWKFKCRQLFKFFTSRTKKFIDMLLE